jgi:hypothetical protein
MLKKVILVVLVLLSFVFAIHAQENSVCEADFDKDGVVDFGDFLLFSNEIEKAYKTGIMAKLDLRFDLTGDRWINFEDFLIFAESYNKMCEPDQVSVSASVSAAIQGDFDGSGCVDEKDFELADGELGKAYNLIEDEPGCTFTGVNSDFTCSNIAPVHVNARAEMARVMENYDLNGDGLIFSLSSVFNEEGFFAGEKAGMASKDKEVFDALAENTCARCSSYTTQFDRNKCYFLVAAKPSVLDVEVCEAIDKDGNPDVNTAEEITLRNICRDKVNLAKKYLE